MTNPKLDFEQRQQAERMAENGNQLDQCFELVAARAEIERLRAAVEEWLCEKCNPVYPGPPQPGFACVQCPKCKGTTGPRQTIELRQKDAEMEKLQNERDYAV